MQVRTLRKPHIKKDYQRGGKKTVISNVITKICSHLLLMVKLPSAIIQDSHDIGVIVLVVIVKRVKHDAQTDPLV